MFVEPTLKPLFANIKALKIGYYLHSNDFKLFMLGSNCDEFWNNCLKTANTSRRFYSLDYIDYEIYEEAFMFLASDWFHNNEDNFDDFILNTLARFAVWSEVVLDFTFIYQELNKLQFEPISIANTKAEIDEIFKAKNVEKQVSQPLHVISKPPVSKSKIFIVHGHDSELKRDVELFLLKLKLDPIILSDQDDEGQTIIEKFERHADVGYAVILLTPDDIAYSISDQYKDDKNRKKENRARQNVIFEFGYFVGKLGRKNVCCIYKKGVNLPSDVNGLIYKEVVKNISEISEKLKSEFKTAGLEI